MPRPRNAAFKCFNLSLQWNPEEITSAKAINWTRSHFRRSRLSSILPFLNKGPIRQAYLPAINEMLASGRSHLRTTTTKSLSDLSVSNGQLKKQQLFLLFLLFLYFSFQVSLCSLPFPLPFIHFIFFPVPSLSFFLLTLLLLNLSSSSFAVVFHTCTHPDNI